MSVLLPILSGEIVPIVGIDGHPVGTGQLGAVTAKLQQAYIEANQKELTPNNTPT